MIRRRPGACPTIHGRRLGRRRGRGRGSRKFRGFRRFRGFSLIESLVAMLLIGLLLVAVLRTVGASRATQAVVERRVLAEELAYALLEEALAMPYEDPEEPGGFGAEGGDPAGSARAKFDDLDDYHGWVGSPPQTRDGQPIPGAGGYERRIDVSRTNPSDLTAAVTEVGLRRVRVRVYWDQKLLADLSALRSAAFESTLSPWEAR